MNRELNVININEDVQGCGPECDHFEHCGRTLEDHLRNMGIEIPATQEPEPTETDPENEGSIKPKERTPEEEAQIQQNISSQRETLSTTHSFSREYATLKLFKNANGEIDLQEQGRLGLLEFFKDGEATEPGSISKDEYKQYIEQVYTQGYVQIPCHNENGDIIYVTELCLDKDGNVTQTEHKHKDFEALTKPTDPDLEILDNQGDDEFYEIATVDKSFDVLPPEPKPATTTLQTPAAQKISKETGITLEVKDSEIVETKTTKPEKPVLSFFQQGLRVIKAEAMHQEKPRTKETNTDAQIPEKQQMVKKQPAAIRKDITLSKKDAEIPANVSVNSNVASKEIKPAITIAEAMPETQDQSVPIAETSDIQTIITNTRETSTTTDRTTETVPAVHLAKTPQAPKQEKQHQDISVDKAQSIQITRIDADNSIVSPVYKKEGPQQITEASTNTTTVLLPKTVEKITSSPVITFKAETSPVIPDEPKPDAPDIEITEKGEVVVRLKPTEITQVPQGDDSRAETVIELAQAEPHTINTINEAIPTIVGVHIKPTIKQNIDIAQTTEKPSSSKNVEQSIVLEREVTTGAKKETETIQTTEPEKTTTIKPAEKIPVVQTVEKQVSKQSFEKQKEQLAQAAQTAITEIRRIQELRRAHEKLSGNNSIRYSPPQNDAADIPSSLVRELEKMAA